MLNWSRWYYGLTHLVVKRGDSKDVASINRFPDGSCWLFMYNTKMEDIWTNDAYTTYHEDYRAAMRIAEKRYGVKAKEPVFGLPKNHPSNPPDTHQ
jgi:hypothetical protein